MFNRMHKKKSRKDEIEVQEAFTASESDVEQLVPTETIFEKCRVKKSSSTASELMKTKARTIKWPKFRHNRREEAFTASESDVEQLVPTETIFEKCRVKKAIAAGDIEENAAEDIVEDKRAVAEEKSLMSYFVSTAKKFRDATEEFYKEIQKKIKYGNDEDEEGKAETSFMITESASVSGQTQKPENNDEAPVYHGRKIPPTKHPLPPHTTDINFDGLTPFEQKRLKERDLARKCLHSKNE